MKYILYLFLTLTLANALVLFGSEVFNSYGYFGLETEDIPGGSSFKHCDISNEQKLRLNYLKFTPSSPRRGTNLTIEASGFLDDEIDKGAYVKLSIRVGYIKLFSITINLCSEFKKNNFELQCPIESGNYNLTTVVEIPKQVPYGKYTVSARAYNYDDSEITCLTGEVALSSFFWL